MKPKPPDRARVAVPCCKQGAKLVENLVARYKCPVHGWQDWKLIATDAGVAWPAPGKLRADIFGLVLDARHGKYENESASDVTDRILAAVAHQVCTASPLTAKAGLDEADCEGLAEEDGKYHHCPGCAGTPRGDE